MTKHERQVQYQRVRRCLERVMQDEYGIFPRYLVAETVHEVIKCVEGRSKRVRRAEGET